MLALTTSQTWIFAVFGALLGAAVGSFCCVIIERLPLKLDEPNDWGDDYDTRPWREIVGGESRCSSCGADIRWIDKIPVLSWFLLRGKCKSCGERIPGFHPLVEFLVPAVGIGLVAIFGWDWRLLPALWLVPVGIVVSFIDFRTYIVPTRIVWPAFFVAVALSVVVAGIEGEWAWLWGGLLGTVILAGPLALLWFALPNGMGFGDVRLATLLGWTLGFSVYTGRWVSVLVCALVLLIAAAVLGIIMGIGGLMAYGRKAKVPFGPALVTATFVVLAVSAPLLDGYGLT